MRSKIVAPLPTGLVRERLDRTLESAWSKRVCVVTGPAGSGKTTLLSQFAAANRPSGTGAGRRFVSWYRAEPTDASVGVVLRHVAHALRPIFGSIEPPVQSVEELVGRLQSANVEEIALVIDDVHNLAGTDADAWLDRLVVLLPPNVVVMVAGRSTPAINLSRLRVADDIVEIDAFDLRFRTWEIERLFRDVYEQRILPEEAASLARRTEGWAAGIQLFHLATDGRSASARRRALDALATRGDIAREYLTQNVLDALPAGVRDLLVRTSVLGRLSGPICDQFLETSGTGAVLADLEQRHLFTIAIDADGTYRYHDVLRSHLEAALTSELGEIGVRREYSRAAVLLEHHGWPAEAVRAHCRGGDLPAAAKVLSRFGAELVSETGPWLDALPPTLIDQDPWLVLARARRHFANGRLEDAVELYGRAETGLTGKALVDLARKERRAANSWLTDDPASVTTWYDVVRLAVARTPLDARARATRMEGAGARLGEGICLLLAGRVADARSPLRDVIEDPNAGDELSCAARLAEEIARLLAGDRRVSELDRVLADCERLELPWLARLACVAVELSAETSAHPRTEMRFAPPADPWGDVIATWLRALRPDRGAVAQDLERAIAFVQERGCGTLEAWARSLLAMTRELEGEGDVAGARSAESFARGVGVPGAQAIALRVLARHVPNRSDEYLATATSIEADCGLGLGPFSDTGTRSDERPSDGTVGTRDPDPSIDDSVSVTCFGAFELRVGPRVADLAQVRPRARSLLRFLTLHSPQPVHRECIVEALWPDTDPRVSFRGLQVAVSSLRTMLAPHGGRADLAAVRRDGDAYQLWLPEGASVDLWRFREFEAGARHLLATHALSEADVLLRAACELADAQFLPEEGPSEWVGRARDDVARTCADVAMSLGHAWCAHGDVAAAIAIGEAGLRFDRYRDELWHLVIDGLDELGNTADAARARVRYREVLASLGLTREPLTAS